MAMAKGWESHPWHWAWLFARSGNDASGLYRPGGIYISDQPSGGSRMFAIPAREMDAISRAHSEQMSRRPGQPVQLPDGNTVEVPYAVADREADALLARRSPPTDEVVDLPISGGERIKGVSRSWVDQIAAAHIERRRREPPVPIRFGTGTSIEVPFEFFDATCKDWTRRRADFLAAGWWPELAIHEPVGAPGPKPVQGRANALGEGTKIAEGPGPVPPHAPDPQGEEAL